MGSRSNANISYPALAGSSNAGSGMLSYEPDAYETRLGGNGFPVDMKEPLGRSGGLSRSNTVMSGGNVGIGFATSDYGLPAASNGGEFQLREPPKGKFSLFPRKVETPSPSLASENFGSSSPDISNVKNSTSPKPRGSKMFPPSLDTWLRAGTVSPFGTLQKK